MEEERMSEEMKELLREVLREELTPIQNAVDEIQRDLIEYRAESRMQFEKLGTVIESFDIRMESLEKNYDEMSRCMDKLEHDHARKDKKISSIIIQYQHLENFISKEIKRLSALQSNQKTIDLLSVRSIQHEADIKELNRVVINSPQHLS
jgi:hypothetical protein